MVEVVPRGLHAAHHVLVQQLQQHCNNSNILNCLAETTMVTQPIYLTVTSLVTKQSSLNVQQMTTKPWHFDRNAMNQIRGTLH